MRLIFLLTVTLVSYCSVYSQSSKSNEQIAFEAYVLKRVNEVRNQGCKCGRKRKKPVGHLQWSETLTYSAYLHAKEMNDYNYFAHRSIDGLDIGQRLDNLGYKWQYVGENLAEGQKTFDEALKDWIASKSHCDMLMNPEMTEMGLAKVGKYWVHHFGKQMPPNARRTKTYYREGE